MSEETSSEPPAFLVDQPKAEKDPNAADLICWRKDGTEYEYRRGEVTARHQWNLRLQTGSSINRMAAMFDYDLDGYAYAMVEWLSRMQAGEDVTFDSVLGSIKGVADEDFGLRVVGAETAGAAVAVEHDSPEA